jgi:hypothetical protein
MVGANFLARVSATCLPSCPLLILPPLPGVSRPRRFNILTTVVVCHLPPWAVGIPLRFNSCASAGREMMPAALSSRMIWTKPRARDSAARLLANPPCTPRRRRDDSACSRSIGPSWLVLDVRLGGKNVAGVVGSFKINNSVAGIRAPAQARVAIHRGTCDHPFGSGLASPSLSLVQPR